MDFIHLKGRGDRLSCCEVSVMDGIESPTDYGDPHDPCLTSSAAESFVNTCCFNSSRPSPVTDEILIICTSFCLHHRCSFADLLGYRRIHLRRHDYRGFQRQLRIVLGKLGADGLVLGDGILFAQSRYIHQMQQESCSVRCDAETACRVRARDARLRSNPEYRPRQTSCPCRPTPRRAAVRAS